MNHYEILGVAQSASKSDIRRAYVKLARRYHPDFNQRIDARPGGVDIDSSLAVKIRQVNAAWEVLGDDDRRADYDMYLIESRSSLNVVDPGSASFRAARAGAPSVSRIKRPSSEFRPKYSGPDPDESFRYGSDAVNPATVPSRILLAAPATCFVVGLALLVLSVPTAIRAFTALGLISLFASAVGFVGVPVVAMFKSRNEELRAERRR